MELRENALTLYPVKRSSTLAMARPRRFATARHLYSRALGASLAVLGLLACSSAPTWATAEFPMEEATLVAYPPPAALPEIVPTEPEHANARWMDGYWSWRGDTWIWQRGGWMAVPPEVELKPWQVRYTDAGKLYWVEQRFVSQAGEPVEPELLEPAGYPPTETAPAPQTVP